MERKRIGWLIAGFGVALIAVYSAIMVTSEGASPWAWLLLIAGIVLLVVGGRQASGSSDE